MFEAYFEAANLIKERGVAAANEAASLIGTPATLAMLLATLTGSDSQKLTELRAAGLTSFADVSDRRAVIYDETGEAQCTLELHGDSWREGSAKGLHVAMWMQGSMEIKQLFAGIPPYTDLKNVMRRSYQVMRAQLQKEFEAVES